MVLQREKNQKNDEIFLRFDIYKEDSQPQWIEVVFTVLICLICPILSYSRRTNQSIEDSTFFSSNQGISGLNIFIELIGGLTLLSKTEIGRSNSSIVQRSMLKDSFLIGITLFFSFLLFSMMWVEDEVFITPYLSTLALIPLIASILMKIEWSVAIINWILTLLSLLVVSVSFGSVFTFQLFITYTPTSFLLLYWNNLNMWKLFNLQKELNECQITCKEEQEAELRTMLGNVAHDFKTPQTSFVGGIELIAQVFQELDSMMANDSFTLIDILAHTESIREYTENLRDVNNFMTMTVNRCVDYTKASRGVQLIPTMKTIDLFAVISEPVKIMRSMQSEVNIKIDVTLVEDICPTIITDGEWLKENVLCLLSNAVKHTPVGTVKLILEKTGMSSNWVCKFKKPVFINPVPTIDEKTGNNSNDKLDDLIERISDTSMNSLTIKPEMLKFSVMDTGDGLSDEEKATIFEYHRQTNRPVGGTGLGLFSLAKRVEALKGRYGVEDRDDGLKGCVFWFEIPYEADSLSPLSSKSRSASLDLLDIPRSTSCPSSLGVRSPRNRFRRDPSRKLSKASRASGITPEFSLRVLVVDDSSPIVKMVAQLLTRQGHHVMVAINGADALEKLYPGKDPTRTYPYFDVVLMDLQMPVMDGLEATRRLRAAEKDMKLISVKHTASFDSSHDWETGFDYLGLHRDNSNQSNISRNSIGSNNSKRQIIIGVSANTDHTTMNEALGAGMDDFMPKPFSQEHFKQSLIKLQLLN